MTPRISVVIPFYNEEGAVAAVVEGLRKVLQEAGCSFQIVAVQNGSHDRTAEILTELAALYAELLVVDVPVNQGFGYGILQGIAIASGGVVGIMPGDGQVPPEAIVAALRRMEETGADVAKARRISRHDGWVRSLVSWSFNRLVRTMFALPQDDVNGHPKLLARELLVLMGLRSTDSFIDAELLLKAQRMGLMVCEVGIESPARETGRSTVSWRTCLEFLGNLVRARLQHDDPWGLHRLPTPVPAREGGRLGKSDLGRP